MKADSSARWIFFVAGRYLKTKRNNRGHLPSILSIIGIAVGVMTLISVMAVMNGFQHGTIESILELNSYHMRLAVQERDDDLIRRLREIPGVETVLPFSEIQVLLRGLFPDPRVGVIRIVPADSLSLDTGMEEHLDLIAGSFDISVPGTVVLGSELARFLGVGLGDTVDIINFTGEDFNVLRPREDRLKITGVFKSGYYDIDLTWAYISFGTAAALYEKQSEIILGVKLENRYNDLRMLARFEEEGFAYGEGGEFTSWRVYNQAIFGALRVEKTVMMLLIGLIFLVVAANIFQSHKRNVYERSEEIGLLRAIGAGPRAVRYIFVVEGLIIGLLGGTIGLLLGLLISGNINGIFVFAEDVMNFFIDILNTLFGYLGWQGGAGVSLFSPAYFYLLEVPSKIFPLEVIYIFLFALVSTTAAAYFASRKTAGINPAEVLRYE